ncbi:MAG TPA: hypothetical protein VNH20_03365 [Candidatus Dormibacteraeota bacterium]|nr:hypothetical protein [Candidatus Dormibacteraeota bacterium]
MPSFRVDASRLQFQERLLTQFRARYSGWEFSNRQDQFGVLARKGSAQVALSLESLYAEARRPGASVPEEIARFVTLAAPRLSSAEQRPEQTAPGLDPGALVWCVRAERAIRGYTRFAELATRELPGGLLAFVAEALPGDAMQGVSRADAEAGGLSEEDLVGHADRNTSLRLTRWREALEDPEEPRRWLFSDDILFSSSLLLVPSFLEALGQLGQGRAALAAPDRALVVAAVGTAAAPETMLPLVRRLFRLASFPLSPLLFATDGVSLELHPAEVRPRHSRPGWRRLFGVA